MAPELLQSLLQEYHLSTKESDLTEFYKNAEFIFSSKLKIVKFGCFYFVRNSLFFGLWSTSHGSGAAPNSPLNAALNS